MKSINLTVSDFNLAWYKLNRHIIEYGEPLVIGNENESHPVIGSPGMIVLKNNAIKQIESHEIHPDYPFKSIQQYVDQFTYDWKKENGTGGFDYTYFDRLTCYCGANQILDLLYGLSFQIRTGLSSNRNHVITWVPKIDTYSNNPPCLQSINIKYINNNQVDVFLYWRSRDSFVAWQSNIIAIIQMLNNYVIRMNDCNIRSIVDMCNNYHIYESDLAAAKGIRNINPQIYYE